MLASSSAIASDTGHTFSYATSQLIIHTINTARTYQEVFNIICNDFSIFLRDMAAQLSGHQLYHVLQLVFRFSSAFAEVDAVRSEGTVLLRADQDLAVSASLDSVVSFALSLLRRGGFGGSKR